MNHSIGPGVGIWIGRTQYQSAWFLHFHVILEQKGNLNEANGKATSSIRLPRNLS
jgi:hypothetical protein